jgi:PIN domain nuclease of toxin-antitoxin system
VISNRRLPIRGIGRRCEIEVPPRHPDLALAGLQPARLRGEVAERLADPDNELWLSPVSVWEVLWLAEKGRIAIGDPYAWVRRALEGQPFREARLSYEIAVASRQLDLPHQDPADRFIAATALVHGLTLITSDQGLIASQAVPTLSNRS